MGLIKWKPLQDIGYDCTKFGSHTQALILMRGLVIFQLPILPQNSVVDVSSSTDTYQKCRLFMNNNMSKEKKT